jgi:hypothetical protein
MSAERERLRRMREVWRLDAPSAFEVATAVSRTRARRRTADGPSGLWLTSARWGSVGAVLGLAAALSFGARPPQSVTPIRPEALPATPPALGPEPSEPAEAKAADVPEERQSPVRARTRAVPKRSVNPPVAAEQPSEPARPDPSGAARWLAIGRGSDAGPIVVGLPKEGTSEPEREPIRNR